MHFSQTQLCAGVLRRAFASLAALVCAAAPAWGAAAAPAAPDALATLDAFVRGSRCGEAAFTQTVTATPRPGRPSSLTRQSGRFAFCRPGRFRFDYAPPHEQAIVADGTTLWVHDVDLKQVTARAQSQALAGSPTAVIATASSIKDLEREFTLSAEAAADGLHWVRALPKAAEGTLRLLRVGLRPVEGGGTPTLVMLDMEDSFGKRSMLRFEDYTHRSTLDEARFRFTPPDGAEVLRPEGE